MKIGVVNNYRKDLSDEILLIASEGFDFVDLTLEPLFSHKLDVKKVKEALEKTQIEVIGHTSPFLPYIFPLKSIRDACMDEFKLYVDFFHSIGVSCMNFHPSTSGAMMSEESMFDFNKKFISDAADICRDKGLTLMVETMTSPFNTPEAFERLLEGVDDVKVHLDVGHCSINTDRNLTEEFFSVFGERIVHVHFSDNNRDRDDHLPLGCGTIDWEEKVAILKKYSYDKTITLEVFTPDRRYLLLSKKYLEEILAK